MSNNWFQFRQFRIEQDQCGMKVSTDACVFGGLLIRIMKGLPAAARALDIGTGTGLLSLMLAQEFPSLHIDAVEIDRDAYGQACYNIEQSSWAGRIRCHYGSIQEYARNCRQQYDLIICNPPFFTAHLPAAEAKRQLARQTTSLSQAELLHAISRMLLPGGLAGLLYPASEEGRVVSELERSGLKVCKKIKIYPSHNKSYNRVVYVLSDKIQVLDCADHFYLRSSNNAYSSDYKTLLQNFLLEKNNFLEKKISIN